MVKINDTVDAVGTLATLSNNTYINTYKGKLPLIESLNIGGDSYSLDKLNIGTLDVGSTYFTYFGYKNYTSTGSYSGLNLITNDAFSSNITGWSSSSNISISHDAVG